MTTQPLTQEQAIETWTSLQMRIQVGAYEERNSEHHEHDTWPDDGVEESVHNLETRAAKQGLEFCWKPDTQSWSLETSEQWRQESVDEAMIARAQLQMMQGEE